jgi:hypothetical protein
LVSPIAEETSGWRRALGVTPGNPFGRWLAWCALGSGGSMFACVVLASSEGVSPDVRTMAAVIAVLVGVVAPIILAMLLIFSRQYVRIQQIVAGDYWAHWRYSPREQALLEANSGDEVYLSRWGIYRPKFASGLIDFDDGLTGVQILEGEVPVLKFDYVHVHKGYRHSRELRLPVPLGREEMAQNLAKQYRSYIGQRMPSQNDMALGLVVMFGGIILGLLVGVSLVMPAESARLHAQYDSRDATRTAEDSADKAKLMAVLPSIRGVIGPNALAELKRRGRGTASPYEFGFKYTDNVSQIIYGYCQDESFYVFVVQTSPTIHPFMGDTGAFVHNSGDLRYTCAPDNWEVTSVNDLGGDWYYVALSTYRATIIPQLTELAKNGFGLTKTPSPP